MIVIIQCKARTEKKIENSTVFPLNILYTVKTDFSWNSFVMCKCACAQSLSFVWPFTTPWIVACEVPLSMEFPRQEYWNGLPFPTPGNLPNPGTEPTSPALEGRFFTTDSLPLAPPGLKPLVYIHVLFSWNYWPQNHKKDHSERNYLLPYTILS